MFKALRCEGRAQTLFFCWDLTLMFMNQTLLLCAASSREIAQLFASAMQLYFSLEYH